MSSLHGEAGAQQIIQVKPLCTVARGRWGHRRVTVGLPDQDQGLKKKGRRKLEPIDEKEKVEQGSAPRSERLLAAALASLGDFSRALYSPCPT